MSKSRKSLKELNIILENESGKFETKINAFKEIAEIVTSGEEINDDSCDIDDIAYSCLIFLLDHKDNSEIKAFIDDAQSLGSTESNFLFEISNNIFMFDLFADGLDKLEANLDFIAEFLPKELLNTIGETLIDKEVSSLVVTDPTTGETKPAVNLIKLCQEKKIELAVPQIKKSLSSNKVPEYAKLIRTADIFEASKEEDSARKNPVKKVIYNIDGYAEGVQTNFDALYEKGSTVKFNHVKPEDSEATIPVGYFIYLPEGEIKAIAVSAYGGRKAKERKNTVERQAKASIQIQELAAEGVAVVKLITPNLLFLDKNQSQMGDEVHTMLHTGINEIFKCLKNNPSDLHENLAGFENQPITLYGASFGGRTAARHAALYPDSFDGYACLNGALDLQAMTKYCSKILRNFKKAMDLWETHTPIIDPANNFLELTKPLMIAQTYNDHTINAKIATSAYNSIKEAGKGDLVRLKIYPFGNITDKKLYKIGHKVGSVSQVSTDLAEFVKNPMKVVSNELYRAESELYAYKYGNYINREHENRDIVEKFLAEAHIKYDNVIKDGKSDFDSIWANELAPIYNALNSLDGLNTRCKVKSLFNDYRKIKSGHYEKALELHIDRYITMCNAQGDKIDPNIAKLCSSDIGLISEFRKIVYRSMIKNSKSMNSKSKYFVKTLLVANPELATKVECPDDLKAKLKAIIDQEAVLAENVHEKELELLTAVQQETENLGDLTDLAGDMSHEDGFDVLG